MIEQRSLFIVWKKHEEDAAWLLIGWNRPRKSDDWRCIVVVARWRQSLHRAFEIHHRQPNLLEIVLARHASRRLASRLHGRQEQPNKNPDDGDDNQQFDQSKSASISHND